MPTQMDNCSIAQGEMKISEKAISARRSQRITTENDYQKSPYNRRKMLLNHGPKQEIIAMEWQQTA